MLAFEVCCFLVWLSGQGTVDVTMKITADGTLTVSAKDVTAGSTGHSGVRTVTTSARSLTREQILRMAAEAQAHQRRDTMRRAAAESQADLGQLIGRVKTRLAAPVPAPAPPASPARTALATLVRTMDAWLTSHKSERADEYDSRRKQLQRDFSAAFP
jgi:molecular chaperone DnaK (HSP70)